MTNINVREFFNLLEDECKVTISFFMKSKYIVGSDIMIVENPTKARVLEALSESMLAAKVVSVKPIRENGISIHADLA